MCSRCSSSRDMRDRSSREQLGIPGAQNWRVCWGGGPPMGQVCACVRRDLRICALLEEPETEIVYFWCTFWTLFRCQTGGVSHFGRGPIVPVSRFPTFRKSSWPPWIVHPGQRYHLMRALLASGRHRKSRPTSDCVLCAEWLCTVCWVSTEGWRSEGRRRGRRRRRRRWRLITRTPYLGYGE